MGVGQRINYSNGHGGDAPETNVIFSYIDGYVWMSWPGYEGRVRVGPCENHSSNARVPGPVRTWRAARQLERQIAFGPIVFLGPLSTHSCH